MAIGGLGGCPFAQDALVGNLATEIAIAELTRLGAELPKLGSLDGLIKASRGIEEKLRGDEAVAVQAGSFGAILEPTSLASRGSALSTGKSLQSTFI